MIVTFIKDFFEGLGRGLNLFLTERNDLVEQAVQPRVTGASKK